MLACPECQTENREGAKFCRSCGANLGAKESAPVAHAARVCAKCSRPARFGDIHCVGCGEKLSEGGKQASVVCTQCRTVVSAKLNFCSLCGNDIQAQIRLLSELFVDDNPELTPKYEA